MTPDIFIKFALTCLLVISAEAFADTQNEIEHLLDFVANTSCDYERNGTLYNGVEARNHITKKYNYYQDKISSAEDFIKYSATKSTISGKKYKIHCADKLVQNSRDWLLDELKRFRDSHTN